MTGISLAPVTEGDRELIFNWRNIPALVKLGSSGREVTWEEHCSWFDRVLNDDVTEVFLIYWKDIPVGQIRFDFEEAGIYIVTIYILDQYTGRGIGVHALKNGVEGMLRAHPGRKFIASIKVKNETSIKAFSRAGFEEITDYQKVSPGHIVMCYATGAEG